MQEKIEEAGCVPIAEKKEKRGEIKRGGEKGGGGDTTEGTEKQDFSVGVFFAATEDLCNNWKPLNTPLGTFTSAVLRNQNNSTDM